MVTERMETERKVTERKATEKKAAERNIWYDRPLKVLPTRVRRTYRGGKNLDLWHGAEEGTDGDRPEEWLASVTRAVNPGFEPVENEGLSRVSAGGEEIFLKDLIALAPEKMLGAQHCGRRGAETGVLAKLLDPIERLSIQVHPDKMFAKQYFHSDYGKTECWHVIAARETDGEEPYLLMGFRPGMTRRQWEIFYQTQNIQGMVESLNRIVPKPGETYLVPGGLPHAIGAGLCMLEIQEPTDYTLRSERTDAAGNKIPDELIHQGLGEKLLMDCFHYENIKESELREKYQIQPQETTYRNGSKYTLLIGPAQTECFAMEKAEIHGKLSFFNPGSFTILIVISGDGVLRWKSGVETIRSGDQFFVPASAGTFEIENQQGTCTVVRCYPPQTVPLLPRE